MFLLPCPILSGSGRKRQHTRRPCCLVFIVPLEGTSICFPTHACAHAAPLSLEAAYTSFMEVPALPQRSAFAFIVPAAFKMIHVIALNFVSRIVDFLQLVARPYVMRCFRIRRFIEFQYVSLAFGGRRFSGPQSKQAIMPRLAGVAVWCGDKHCDRPDQCCSC